MPRHSAPASRGVRAVLVLLIIALGMTLAHPWSAVAMSDAPVVVAIDPVTTWSPLFSRGPGAADACALTQMTLLTLDERGYPVAGDNVASVASRVAVRTHDDQTESITLTVNKALSFHDGTPLTARDVVFTLYVALDRAYDGPYALKRVPIEGAMAYRYGVSEATVATAQTVTRAGVRREPNDDLSPSLYPLDGIDDATQAAVWRHLPKAGAAFARAFVDHITASLTDNDVAHVLPGRTRADLKAKTTLSVAYALIVAGLAAFDGASPTHLRTATGATLDLDRATLEPSDVWRNAVAHYGYDFSEHGLNALAVDGDTLESYVIDAYLASDDVTHIPVETVRGLTCEGDTITLTLTTLDPDALLALVMPVVSAHTVDDLVGPRTSVGVVRNAQAMMACLKKSTLGAGPYRFTGAHDGIVTLAAWAADARATAPLRVCVQTLDGEARVKALGDGTLDLAAVDVTPQAYQRLSTDTHHLGVALAESDAYGYVALNAARLNDWALRRALVTLMDPTEPVRSYFGDLAVTNLWPMPGTLWACPQTAASSDPFDDSGQRAAAHLRDAGYVKRGDRLMWPQRSGRGNTPVTLTLAIPAPLDRHPAGSMVRSFCARARRLGVTVDVQVVPDLAWRLARAEMPYDLWVLAFASRGPHPAYMATWCSDSSHTAFTLARARGLCTAFADAEIDEKVTLSALNDTLIRTRRAVTRAEREALYHKAVTLAASLAVELSTYRRRRLLVYNATRLDLTAVGTLDAYTPLMASLRRIRLKRQP